MKAIGFTGHRNCQADSNALQEIAREFKDALWLHGGAEGFDTQVEVHAEFLDIIYFPIRPVYKSVFYLPKRAPLVRNEIIVQNCSLLVACWDGRTSGGTYETIQFAKRIGREIRYLEARKI